VGTGVMESSKRGSGWRIADSDSLGLVARIAGAVVVLATIATATSGVRWAHGVARVSRPIAVGALPSRCECVAVGWNVWNVCHVVPLIGLLRR
jgi:hypothetical protein